MNSVVREDIKKIIESFSGWERFRDKTILISGANGFLPAYMVETLVELNNVFDNIHVKVIALVRNNKKAQKRFSHLLANNNLKIVVKDVCDEIIIDEKIDYIIHAASQASPKYYGIDPVGTLSANVIGTINLAKLAVKNKPESFLYFSSGEIYGELPEKDMPVSETTFGYLDPAKVRSCYGESKRMGETICVSYLHQYGVKAKIVRPFHTYGPGMQLDDGRVFADFVSNVISKKDIILNSDGSAQRAFCYLTDATVAFFTVLLNGKDGDAYNVGNPAEEYSILELAKIILDIRPELNLKIILNKPAGVNTYLKSPMSRNSPNIHKLSALGWQPQVSAREGFERTVKSFS
ncbi:MAG: NAD-dependent epimerase/dehydratase family protein [Verrucomicrobiota bacterium]|nr:NAD-dependent epimerase/dehydratase family protein [Verrucomicrobiota bacterium]